MRCQNCGQRQATVQLSRTVQGQKRSEFLCDRCAAASQTADSLWGSLFDSILPGPSLFGYPASLRKEPAGRVCPSCGETERELKEKGLLGCEQCYDTFSTVLDPVFRRVQWHTRHIEAPGQSDGPERVRELRQRLDQAVKDEAYEEAAKIRDEIQKHLQGEEGGD